MLPPWGSRNVTQAQPTPPAIANSRAFHQQLACTIRHRLAPHPTFEWQSRVCLPFPPPPPAHQHQKFATISRICHSQQHQGPSMGAAHQPIGSSRRQENNSKAKWVCATSRTPSTVSCPLCPLRIISFASRFTATSSPPAPAGCSATPGPQPSKPSNRIVMVCEKQGRPCGMHLPFFPSILGNAKCSVRTPRFGSPETLSWRYGSHNGVMGVGLIFNCRPTMAGFANRNAVCHSRVADHVATGAPSPASSSSARPEGPRPSNCWPATPQVHRNNSQTLPIHAPNAFRFLPFAVRSHRSEPQPHAVCRKLFCPSRRASKLH